MRVCSYLLWQNQMFQRTFAFRNAELICLFVRACKCWQQTTRKITGIRSNLLTFQNLSCLLLLRLARGSRKCSFPDSGPPSSHTLLQKVLHGAETPAIVHHMYLKVKTSYSHWLIPHSHVCPPYRPLT